MGCSQSRADAQIQPNSPNKHKAAAKVEEKAAVYQKEDDVSPASSSPPVEGGLAATNKPLAREATVVPLGISAAATPSEKPIHEGSATTAAVSLQKAARGREARKRAASLKTQAEATTLHSDASDQTAAVEAQKSSPRLPWAAEADGGHAPELEETNSWDASPVKSPKAARRQHQQTEAAEDAPGSWDATPDEAVPKPLAKLGVGGTNFNANCPALRCSSCNFDVKRFRAHTWHSSADYVYFRNYAGHSYNLDKLRAKLVKSPSSAAYCCQCSWQSLSHWKDLDQWGSNPGDEGGAANGDLRWKKAAAKKKAFGAR